MEVPALWEVPEEAEREKKNKHHYQSAKPESCVVFKHSLSLQPVSPFSLAESGNTLEVITAGKA